MSKASVMKSSGSIVWGGLAVLGLALYISLLIISPTKAVSSTWTNGNANNLWSDPGNWDSGITPSTTANTAIFDGTSAANVTVDIDVDLSALSINSGYTGTLTQSSSNVTTTGNFSISDSSANYDLNGNDLNIGGTFSNDGTLRLDGGETLTYTNDTNSGTVIYTGDGSSTFNTFAAGTSYFNLEYNASGSSWNLLPSVAVSIAGNLTYNDGSVTYDGGTSADVEGNITINGGSINLQAFNVAGNFTDNSGDFGASGSATLHTFDGTGTSTIDISPGSDRFNTLVLAKTGGGGVEIASGDTVAANHLDYTSGTIRYIGGNLTVNDTFTIRTGWDGGDDQAVQMLAGPNTEINVNVGAEDLFDGDLIINSSGGRTVRILLSNLIMDGTGQDLTITAGTLDLNGKNLTVAGTFSNSSTLKLDGSETVTITNDTDSGTILYENASGGTLSSLAFGNSYYNVVFDGSSSPIFQHTSSLDINGNLEIRGGTVLDSNGQDVNLAGNYTVTGTYTSGSNTFVLDGTSQTLNGATTFNNLTKTVSVADTLTLTASQTFTISGTATLNGVSGSLLSLRSSASGTVANIDPQGTRSFQYLDVKDMNNTNATAANCTVGCSDSGNNTNWVFVVTDSGSSSMGVFNPPKPPTTGNFEVTINNGSSNTENRMVNLTFNYGPDSEKIAISNRDDFLGAGLVPLESSMEWDLCKDVSICGGSHIVYVKFYTSFGQSTSVVSDSILLGDQANVQIEEQVLVEGTLVKELGQTSIYIIENGTKRPFPSARVFEGYGYDWAAIINVVSLSDYPLGSIVQLPDSLIFVVGGLIKGSGPDVYFIDVDGALRVFTNEDVFIQLGFSFANVIEVDDSKLLDKEMGDPIDSSSIHPDGTLIKYIGDPKVFLVENGIIRWIKSEEVFNRMNLNWDFIVEIDLAQFPYTEGTIIN